MAVLGVADPPSVTLFGYNRAGRIMDQLYEYGIVSAQDGSKPRQVLISDEATLERLLESL